MEAKKVYFPLFYRLAASAMDLFLIYSIVYFTVINEENLTDVFLVYGSMLLLFLLLTIIAFTNHDFSGEKITVKTLFLRTREIPVSEICGFAVQQIRNDRTFRVYSENKHLQIQVSGKKLRTAVDEFMDELHDSVKAKNIEELKTAGIRAKINRNKEIVFYDDNLEYTRKGLVKKYFYKDLNVEFMYKSIMRFIAEDNTKIEFTIYNVRGKFGLFEYLSHFFLEGEETGDE